jgi:cysteine desulfurase / selenocysteine lyase
MPLNPEQIRKDFPALHQQVNGRDLVYLDNAATTQKPQQVIDRLQRYYTTENSNIHRGAHFLSQQATEAYEGARKTIRGFLNAPHERQVIFTRGTTESINLVASSFCKKFVQAGDEVLVSAMEHHSNIVPWQIACQDRQARLKVIPINDRGELLMDEYRELLNNRTRIVAVTHVSNALGSINPIREMIRLAHEKDIPVLIDGAQAVPHLSVDVQELDCDFYCISAHKMYGPMGVGVLYGKEEWLEKLPPYQGGGEMIRDVRFSGTTYNELPFKFEAGTPNVGDVLGMEAAVKYLQQFDAGDLAAYEEQLLHYALEQLQAFEQIRFVGSAEMRTGVVSFLFEDIHPYDTGTILDKMGIAVRTGHHCAQPLMEFFGIPGTVRVSLGIYNTRAEIDALVEGLKIVRNMFG